MPSGGRSESDGAVAAPTGSAPARLYGSTAPSDDQRAALRDGRVPVAVYGLGKMGLPLATVFAELTGNVVGADVDDETAAAVDRGDCPVAGEPGLPAAVADAVAAGALSATNDPADAARAASVHVVVVPTLVREGRVPDLSTLRGALESVAAELDPGDAVFVESTVPPGTCRDVVAPLLAAESGLDRSAFGVAFCPERTSSGRALEDVRGAYPKVVGGVDGESARVARLVYDELSANEVRVAADARTAECVKVFEGIYRDVNIALANELARFSGELDVDVREAVAIANTQPYCDLHDPGAGVGGHCIPNYPYFLASVADGPAPLIRTAREVNDDAPLFAARKLTGLLRDGGVDPGQATVAVLGLAYRAGVAETRNSPARPIAAVLDSLGATVLTVDPLIDDHGGFAGRRVALSALPECDLDGAVLVTAHEAFEEIDWSAFDGLAVVDGRDALALEETDHAVYTIGRR